MINKMIKSFNTAAQVSHLVSNLSANAQEEKIQKANDIIKNHVGFAASAGLIPLPGADLAAVTAVQLNMLRQLANVYEVNFMKSVGKNIIAAVVGGGVARIGASLIKAIPGVGTIIGEMGMASLSAASTYGLGKMFSNHFAKGGTLENFDVRSSRKIYEEEVKKSHEVIAESVKNNDNTSDVVEKLKKIAELKEAGVINEEEFLLMKSKLIAHF